MFTKAEPQRWAVLTRAELAEHLSKLGQLQEGPEVADSTCGSPGWQRFGHAGAMGLQPHSRSRALHNPAPRRPLVLGAG